MDLLSISPSYPSTSLRGLHLSHSKPSISAFNSRIANPLSTNSSRTALKCMLASSRKSPKTLDFVSQPENFYGTSRISATQTPDTAMSAAVNDIMGLLFSERIVFLSGEIDDFMADTIISQLLLLDAKDPNKEIRIFINSLGSNYYYTNTYSPMAIYDALQLVRAPVSTIALGISASTASLILGGGTKGRRLAMPNTRISIHQPVGGAGGEALEVEIQSLEAIYNKNTIIKTISGFTGRSLEQVEKDIEWERSMSPIEAIEYGIIDDVIDRDSILPLMPVPENVEGRIELMGLYAEGEKFLNPDIPDDEIY